MDERRVRGYSDLGYRIGGMNQTEGDDDPTGSGASIHWPVGSQTLSSEDPTMGWRRKPAH